MNATIAPTGIRSRIDGSLPGGIVAVATAIPAFIGYTAQATLDGTDCTCVPVKIGSMAEFDAIFTGPPGTRPQAPRYRVTVLPSPPADGDDDAETVGFVSCRIAPDPATVYWLRDSVRMFFENGGTEARIVSAGPFGAASGHAAPPGAAFVDALVNPNVRLADLQAALAALKTSSDVTLYVVPEATLLPDADALALTQSLLAQSAALGTCLTLLDVKGGLRPDPQAWPQDIAAFRRSTGDIGLDFGAAYYPFLITALRSGTLDYTDFDGGDARALLPVLNPDAMPNPAAAQLLQAIAAGTAPDVAKNHQALLIASPAYAALIAIVERKAGTLPPSGAVAGIFARVDADAGVWTAPANVVPAMVADLTLRLSDQDQAGLNVDAVSGKSIDAFRLFAGRGVVLWGARTLDGNSQDWRYVPVRRTAVMVEQSIRAWLRSLVFAANDANTWAYAQSAIEQFLTGLWQAGGLQGTKPSEAFAVQVGLGTTMTADDLLDGVLRITVLLAITRPAEFIVIGIEQPLAIG
ncbi:phage tail sheath family protein [Lysobacter hankyongensis]|uniref:Tail sheath protein C-terminal domain-containing protein n=1 Tax=Lysobacter hankyongensis TaxID=1176535 RepID=A0ABP9AUV1_9GAMM